VRETRADAETQIEQRGERLRLSLASVLSGGAGEEQVRRVVRAASDAVASMLDTAIDRVLEAALSPPASVGAQFLRVPRRRPRPSTARRARRCRIR
jgi:hypothetical protein